METRRRLRWLIGGALAVFLVLCLCSVSLFLWRGDQIMELLGLRKQVGAAQFLPADTTMYVGLSLNLRGQPGYDNLKTLYFDNPDVEDAWESFLDNAEDQGNISFEDDIKPWIGTEVALAFPELEMEEFNSGAEPSFLLALAARDESKARTFLESAALDGEKEEHVGVDYWVLKGDPFRGDFAATVLNGFVLFSSSEATLREAINQARTGNEHSLAESKAFQQVLNALPNNSSLYVVIDPNDFLSDLSQAGSFSLMTAPSLLQQTEALEHVGVAISVQPDGIQFDSAVLYDMEGLPDAARAQFERPANSNAILSYVPDDALFFVTSSSLDLVWEQVREQLEETPEIADQIEAFEDEFRIDLNEDIFGWMTGEFTLVITNYHNSSFGGSLPITGYLMVGTDDLEQAESSVEDVSEQLGQEMNVTLESDTIGGVDVQNLIDSYTEEPYLSLGFLDSHFILATPDGVRVASDAPAESIQDDTRFKQVMARLPTSNWGVTYVNLERLRDTAEDEYLSDDPTYNDQLQPLLKPLRAVGFATSAELRGNVQTSRLFILLDTE